MHRRDGQRGPAPELQYPRDREHGAVGIVEADGAATQQTRPLCEPPKVYPRIIQGELMEKGEVLRMPQPAPHRIVGFECGGPSGANPLCVTAFATAGSGHAPACNQRLELERFRALLMLTLQKERIDGRRVVVREHITHIQRSEARLQQCSVRIGAIGGSTEILFVTVHDILHSSVQITQSLRWRNRRDVAQIEAKAAEVQRRPLNTPREGAPKFREVLVEPSRERIKDLSRFRHQVLCRVGIPIHPRNRVSPGGVGTKPAGIEPALRRID
eukprot:scaffold21265_cov131-Isochrysis_galbana.AAC.8